MNNLINYNFDQKRIGSNVKDAISEEHQAVVCKADPENNCCDIYLNTLNWRKIKNVPVKLYDNGTSWFPVACNLNKNSTEDDFKRSLNSLVTVQSGRNGYIITGPWMVPYYRMRASLGEDIGSDSVGADPGGAIVP